MAAQITALRPYAQVNTTVLVSMRNRAVQNARDALEKGMAAKRPIEQIMGVVNAYYAKTTLIDAELERRGY